MFIKRGALFTTILLVVFLAIGCSSQASTPDVVATVNGVEIGKSLYEETVSRFIENYEFQGVVFEGEEGETLLEQVKEMALNSLIEQEAILQEAKKAGYEVSEDQLNDELNSVKEQFESEEEFQAALEEHNYTEASFKALLKQDILIDMFLESNLEEPTVTEDEMLEAYNGYLEEAELYAEIYGEEFEVQTFEELKDEIELSIKQQKQNQQIGDLIDQIISSSQIEIFI